MNSTLAFLGPYAVFGGSAGAAFMFVRFLLDWLAGRIDKNRANLDAGTQKHIERLERLIERQDDKIAQLEKRQEECERERSEMRGQIAELRAALNSRGEIRQRAQQIIAADKLDEKIAVKIAKAAGQ